MLSSNAFVVSVANNVAPGIFNFISETILLKFLLAYVIFSTLFVQTVVVPSIVLYISYISGLIFIGAASEENCKTYPVF